MEVTSVCVDRGYARCGFDGSLAPTSNFMRRHLSRFRRSSSSLRRDDYGIFKLLARYRAPQTKRACSRDKWHLRVRVLVYGSWLSSHLMFSWFRHPSYAGFYYWALGTQLVLQNPLNFCLYLVLLWKFFYYRTQCK